MPTRGCILTLWKVTFSPEEIILTVLGGGNARPGARVRARRHMMVMEAAVVDEISSWMEEQKAARRGRRPVGGYLSLEGFALAPVSLRAVSYAMPYCGWIVGCSAGSRVSRVLVFGTGRSDGCMQGLDRPLGASYTQQGKDRRWQKDHKGIRPVRCAEDREWAPSVVEMDVRVQCRQCRADSPRRRSPSRS